MAVKKFELVTTTVHGKDRPLTVMLDHDKREAFGFAVISFKAVQALYDSLPDDKRELFHDGIKATPGLYNLVMAAK